MLPNNSTLGSAFICTPVAICSPSLVFLSRTIKAPVFVLDKRSTASTMIGIACSHEFVFLSLIENTLETLLRPTFSNIRLNSGWNNTTKANIPLVITLSS